MNFLLSSIVWEEGYSLPFVKVLYGDLRFGSFGTILHSGIRVVQFILAPSLITSHSNFLGE
jgi:hypothetical protein